MSSSASSPAAGAIAAGAARLLRTRWLVRAPIALYRARLGFLFGSRLLMLEHVGRKSAARRYVVLEVVNQPRPGTYLVASGFGDRAQWFRNVRAHPGARVYVGGRRPAPVTARLLSGDETAAALEAYAAGHPRGWAALKPVFEATIGAPISEQEPRLPIIALEPAAGRPRGRRFPPRLPRRGRAGLAAHQPGRPPSRRLSP